MRSGSLQVGFVEWFRPSLAASDQLFCTLLHSHLVLAVPRTPSLEHSPGPGPAVWPAARSSGWGGWGRWGQLGLCCRRQGPGGRGATEGLPAGARCECLVRPTKDAAVGRGGLLRPVLSGLWARGLLPAGARPWGTGPGHCRRVPSPAGVRQLRLRRTIPQAQRASCKE